MPSTIPTHRLQTFALLLIPMICSAFLQKASRTLATAFRRHPNKRYSTPLSPDPENSRFGRQDYWNTFYQQEQNFSWYATWDELAPFVEDFIPNKHAAILLPGVGNDATLVDMYQVGGYRNLTAMDYAPEAIERCREMLGAVSPPIKSNSIELVVADARNLRETFQDGQFDAVFEKGTLDAIFLSGGQDKDLALQNMKMAISELGRCIKQGGIFLSIAGVVTDAIQESFDDRPEEWECLVDKDDLYMSEEGFTSNNIDGTLLVWRKK